MKLGKWTAAVHAFALAYGKPITASEAIERFGNPSGVSSAVRLLRGAWDRGWFMRCEVDGVALYTAVEVVKRPQSSKRTREANVSYFDGIKRVRSIFELGDSL
jgi:hypothetical protein